MAFAADSLISLSSGNVRPNMLINVVAVFVEVPIFSELAVERMGKKLSVRVEPGAESGEGLGVTVSKRLEKTARYFKNLGTLAFWSQLVCTTVSAGILSFSAVATGNATSPFTFYATGLGIVAAFVSVFRSFGYIRLSKTLRRTATEPAKAPPRAAVVKNLRNSIVLSVVGMGAAVLGMQATVGALVAKALTTSSVPYYQGISAGQSPVLALDVFLVQVCIVSSLHFDCLQNEKSFQGLVLSLPSCKVIFSFGDKYQYVQLA
uniref:Protein TIC 21, chloroplastic n=1 Tax=Aegilops tauschii TaxID=37682 RepID=M8BLU7_AEGTA